MLFYLPAYVSFVVLLFHSRALFLPLSWVTAGVAAAALRQVPQASISGLFSSDDHPPGTRTTSPPFLLYEAEHPNPSL
jgi:hypothetical protein